MTHFFVHIWENRYGNQTCTLPTVPTVNHCFLGPHPWDAGHSNKGLIVCLACIYAKSPESQLCPIRVAQLASSVLCPTKKMKKERKIKERKKEVDENKFDIATQWHPYDTNPTALMRLCILVHLKKCNVLPHHREPLQPKQQEECPLGFCFLCLWFPTDCLCPHVNRISDASFNMVLCPVLASWQMKPCNRVSEHAQTCAENWSDNGFSNKPLRCWWGYMLSKEHR